ncbi:hypothetical protein [Kitasatospora sp. GP82]|uniref:hypothetical protein n=1 Tax=Kitasatospora sp. GP82 TaxID=3035089 RepID=UPI002475A28A|nr:hypothetical protein [Kitasatospora sp. GP82]
MSARQAEAMAAEAELAEALRLAGIVLPSLATDQRSGLFTGLFLVDLGGARADVVERLAEVVRRGVEAELADRKAGSG